MNVILDRVASPIGRLSLVSEGDVLLLLEFEEYEERFQRAFKRFGPGATLTSGHSPEAMRRRIEAYFAGELSQLDDIQVHPHGTEFQLRVWQELRRIPPGTTTSYGHLATTIGRPKAVRAVGHANGANPISIVIPCHRVIGADASLTGYGGGLPRKAWLLRHEAANAPSMCKEQVQMD